MEQKKQSIEQFTKWLASPRATEQLRRAKAANKIMKAADAASDRRKSKPSIEM